MFLNFIERVSPFLLSFCLPYQRSPLEVVRPSNAPVPLSAYCRPLPSARASAKVGRNESCPCASGKKHKHCCGA